MKKILMIATGGTIASKGTAVGLAPELTSQDILHYIPSLKDICEVETLQLCNLDSTNISMEHWMMMANAIEERYERYDGFGYPVGLKEKEIPYLARVLTVIDSFDAMTSSRPYNKRKTYDEGLIVLERCSGTQFDPEIVCIFSEVVKENINEIQDF